MDQDSTPSVAATVGLSRKIGAAVAAFAALGAASEASAQYALHVAQFAQPGGDGLTWETAVPTIHDAIELMSGHPGWMQINMIKLAQGRYHVTDPLQGSLDDSLVLQSGMTLIGGFRGPFGLGSPHERDPQQFASVLDGDIGIRGHAGDNTEVAVRAHAGGRVEIDGVQFENFRGAGFSRLGSGDTVIQRCTFRPGFHPSSRCISIHGNQGNVLIDECRFTGQVTGDAIVGVRAQTIAIRDSQFISNVLGHGAVNAVPDQALTIDSCVFVGNQASRGVILSDSRADLVEIRGSRIANTIDPGGAWGFPPVYVAFSEWVVINGCDISDNACTGNVGGGLLLDNIGNALITNTSFTGNFAPNDGGAIYAAVDQSLFLIGCLITDNLAGDAGGGIWSDAVSTQLVNCTIADNQAGQAQGAGLFTVNEPAYLFSSIAWNNRLAGQPPSASTYTSQVWPVGMHRVQDSLVTSVTNGLRSLSLDPRFTGIGDYRLRSDSPAINFGQNSTILPRNGLVDLAGTPRVIGRFVDAGCYETPGLPEPCGTADLATSAVRGLPGYRIPDAIVNSDDFFAFIDAWSAMEVAADLTTTAVPGTPGYLVPDGFTDSADFFVFLALYQQGC